MTRLFTFPLVIFLLFICCITESRAQTLAFPGAEGFGRFATGGRGGEVHIVTNLNDSGPGSFREAVSQPNRIVVFEVGGVINIGSRIVVSPNVTIAGQTAPGDGVAVYGNGFSFSIANNSIVRYLRIRMGKDGDSGKDALTVTDNANNIIFDHLSVSWGRDENFSITGDADSITIQDCIIAQGLETHSCGGLLEPSGALSLYRNLYIDNNTRNPKVKGINQFVNNVIYNWGEGGAYIMGGSAGNSYANIISNYYISGPSSTARVFSRGTPTFVPYVEGNFHDGNLNGALDGALVPQSEYEDIDTFRDDPYDYPMPSDLMTAGESYAYVIDHAGANYPYRDEVDAFLIDEIMSLGTEGVLIADEAELPMGGPGEVHGAPAPADTDRDGMPDEWETTNGLDPEDPSDAMTINPDGYANIEKYINELPGAPAPDFLRPPSQVSPVTVSETEIDISWQDNSDDETEFTLERSENGVDYTEIDNLPENTTAYEDSGLEPNQVYYYRLKAVNDTEESVYSLAASAKTLPVPSAPDPPSDPSPADQSKYADTTNLILQWTGSENTEQYSLYLGTDPENLEHVKDLTENTDTIADLSGNTVYYWRVDATNNLGLTTGDVWSFTSLKSFPNSLVGDWQLDAASGTTAADSSEYEVHGEIKEITDFSWTEGARDNALDLTAAASNTHILIPHADHFYFDKHSFTIAFWMKAAEPEHSYLIHKGTFAENSSGGTGKWFGIEVKDGVLRFSVDDDRTKSVVSVSDETYYTNTWVHVAAIRNVDDGRLRLYRNGVLVSESNDNTTGGIGETEPIIVGNSNDLNVGYAGMLDEIKLYNYSLEDAELLSLIHEGSLPIQPFGPSVANGSRVEGFGELALSWHGGVNTDLYKFYFGTDQESLDHLADVDVSEASYVPGDLDENSEYYWRVDAVGPAGTMEGEVWSFETGFRKGLVGYWQLNEKNGTEASDVSRHHNHGEVAGFETPSWGIEGRSGTALRYDAPADTAAVIVPHAGYLSFDRHPFTLSLWVNIAEDAYDYVDDTGNDAYLIHKGTFAGKWYGIQLRDGNLTFAIDDGSVKTDLSVNVDASSDNHIFTNEWKHVAAVRDENEQTLRLYIDGELVGETSSSTGSIGTTLPVTIGNSAERKPYRDLMDEVRLYNYALTDEDIETLFQSGSLIAAAQNPSPEDESVGVGTEDLVFSWEGEAETYDFYLGIAGDALELEAEGLTETGYAAPGLTRGESYRWQIVSYSGSEAAASKEWIFTTASITGLHDPSIKEDFTCYPNAFSNRLNIRFYVGEEEKVSLKIHDLKGRTVRTLVNTNRSPGLHFIQWDGADENKSEVKAGLYVCVLQTSRGRKAQKIIFIK